MTAMSSMSVKMSSVVGSSSDSASSRLYFVVVVITLMLANFTPVFGQTCKQPIPPKNKCSCNYDDGSGTVVGIDFEPLGNSQGSPAFPYKTATDTYEYAYNPCYPFSDTHCTDAAACQVSSDGKNAYTIGDPSDPQYDVSNKDIVLTYTSGTRQSIVNFHCDPKALHEATYSVQGEVPPASSTYKFVIGTCLACVPAISGCHAGANTGGGGLSVGGILCIVFTVLVVVYIVAGILFQKYARGATGKEMVPNYSFWSDFPLLVKDGFMHLIGLCKGESSDYEAIK